MKSAQAITELETAFANKARPATREDKPARLWVGCFGNAVPDVLLAAAGCRFVDVKAIPDAELNDVHQGMARFIEPFLDDYTRVFLHRLACGRLDHLRAIVFSRQDAAALVAYQYALEYQRQHQADTAFPTLLLWNAEQGTTEAVMTFNQRQASQLLTRLAALGAAHPSKEDIATAIEQVRTRHQALDELTLVQRDGTPRLTALEVLRWRNAGRYLDPAQFSSQLRTALSDVSSRPARMGKRLGLVGTATDSEDLYRMLDSVGCVVADLQPFGQAWPGPMSESDDLDGLLNAMAIDPFCPRGRSSIAMVDALADACALAQCDAVIAQMDQNDDTFGWDLPSLEQALNDRGIPLLQLGFRDLRPDGDWITRSRERLTTVLGDL
ncbi:2-hydroxyacyl-CoA dehydratase family protein [Saccharospirillum alexandrii]|uniref:2-hydroxyacyl-CoA dehydratase family protein n=1 Tax=Saccharospirillum alexandrii TaxID=2448477 RepID=UPI000FDC05E0|nr:2-hydroxyacyl-CoA dehydratase family protein [Saccharospirillum alexandrii]